LSNASVPRRDRRTGATEGVAGPRRAVGEAPRDSRTEHGAERRTVVIRGHGAPVPSPRRRPASSPSHRLLAGGGHRPDRMAMWAVFLGLFLVVLAAASGQA
jgi:hypothetical protein